MAGEPDGKPKANWKKIVKIVLLVIGGLLVLLIGACFVALGQQGYF